MRKQLVIALADLRYIEISCLQCGAVVRLDMKERSALAKQHGFFAPLKCPGCHANHDSAIVASVDRLQELYEKLTSFGELGEQIRFVSDRGEC